MPAPLVVVGVLALVALVASGLGISLRQLFKHLANKRLTILGSQKVGKTTLFQTLQYGRLPGTSRRTVDPEPGSEFILRIRGKDVHFEMPEDLPGHDGVAFPRWRKAFENADHVWYLFRADLLIDDDPDTVARVSEHLELFKMWMRLMDSPHPKVILIGNFADRIEGYPENHAEVYNRVANSDPIKASVVKLEHAGLVVGSLSTEEMAKRLVRSINEELS